MLKSRIEVRNHTPILYINEKETTAMAYTTYFPERGCHEDFIDAGYRIFFVNISFTTLPINSYTSGFSPFRTGVFENPRFLDYEIFEDEVRKILEKCPDAIIFPRIYISMPKWWIETHPKATVQTPKGGYREILFSEEFRTDASKLLRELVGHIKNSDYSDRVGGWQICGGQTQEWFHHDLNGSLCENAKDAYFDYVMKEFGETCVSLPKKEDYTYTQKGFNECENAQRYSIFCNMGVAETIDIFAKTIKEETNFEQIVGVFYGYSFESCSTVLQGSHALRMLLDSPNLDFFSSPNAYSQNRSFGIDWADMIPVNSVVLHKKLCFIECDIRTSLTTGVQEARPGEYPENIYRTDDGKSVWAGPPTIELSIEAMKKSFAHQITKASAIWWFDMWGKWYDDPQILQELAKMKNIYDKISSEDKKSPTPEVIFFADETGYANLFSASPQLEGIESTRIAMGNTGVPYDIFMAEDASLVLKNYKAAIFPMPIASKAGKHAIELCKKLKVPYLCASEDHYELSVDEIRKFYEDSGIHFFTNEKDVVYAGNGYVALHTGNGGMKSLKFSESYTISPIFGTDVQEQTGREIEFFLKENATALFYVSK